jgi:hypothetical protein
MNILRKLRNGKSAVQAYNNMRLTFAILGLAFTVTGVADMFGFGGTVTLFGEEAVGVTRVIASLLLVVFGVLFLYVRVTVFRKKRKYTG